MKITVTGATGFVGSHFLNEVLDSSHEVQAVRRPGSRTRIPIRGEPDWIEGELKDVSEAMLCGTDCLVHLAAHGVDPTAANWMDSFRVNVTESLALWLRAARAGVKSFVVIGSCFEFGSGGETYEFIAEDAPLRPTGPYHASKAAATMAASAFAHTEGVKVWVLRPFQIYGEGESPNRLYPQILRTAQSGADLDLTEGNQVRDFMHVRDVAKLVHGYALLLVHEMQERFFKTTNLGTGEPKTIRAFTEQVWSSAGGKGRLNFGALPYRKGEVMRYVPVIDRDEQALALAAVEKHSGRLV
jgi:nucleoside-diphosphate-sugar epimerase